MANRHRLQRAWHATFGQALTDAQPVWPFFVMLTVAMFFIYFWSMRDSPRLQASSGLVIVFTALTIVYVALFWLSPLWALRQPHATIYLIVQTALAFTLTLLVQNAALVFGLFAALVGVTVGMLGRTRRMLAAVALEMGISALAFVLIAGSVALGPWALSIGPVVVFVIVYVVMYVREIEARSQAQQALHELDVANRQLTEYAAQVEDLTLANERQRMARELHDTLSQGLAGLILQLEAVDSHLSRGRTAKAQAIVQQAMDRARTTLADARRAIDDLRASDRPSPELAELIQLEADHFSVATGLPCDLDVNVPPDLPVEMSDNIQRMISEALTNIARHAKATRVQLQLRSNDHAITVTIHDDGQGFDLAAIDQGHYGLIGLRERARLMGGTLNINSQVGQGTTLRIVIPYVEARVSLAPTRTA